MTTAYRTSTPEPLNLARRDTSDLKGRLDAACDAVPGSLPSAQIWRHLKHSELRPWVESLDDAQLRQHVADYSEAYRATRSQVSASEATSPAKRADVVRPAPTPSASPDPVVAAKAKGLSFPVDPSMRPPSDDGRADALEAIGAIGDPVARAEARARYEQENAWRGGNL